jgi:hypothetical protein
MEGTSVQSMLGLAPEVQEPPVNFFRASPNFAQFGNSDHYIDSTGESRETGGAWPLWLGFFCLGDCPQQPRELSNTHSNAPRLIGGARATSAPAYCSVP